MVKMTADLLGPSLACEIPGFSLDAPPLGGLEKTAQGKEELILSLQ